MNKKKPAKPNPKKPAEKKVLKKTTSEPKKKKTASAVVKAVKTTVGVKGKGVKTKTRLKQVKQQVKRGKQGDQKITKVSDFIYRVQAGKRSQIYLIGTAHVSKKSVELVKSTLDKYRPETVYLELDRERKESLNRDRLRNLDILKIIKENKIIYFLFYLVLGMVQKKIAEKYGTVPGGEFLATMEWANQHQREVVLIDRSAQITLKRTWRSMRLKEQFSFLFSGIFSGEEIEDFDVEDMKEDDVLTHLVKKLGIKFPQIKRIVIDERDEIMSAGIIQHVERVEAGGAKKTGKTAKNINKVNGVAVVGAGHLAGMKQYFADPEQNTGRDLSDYEKIPPPHLFWKILPWAFTGTIFLVFLAGFWYTDIETVKDAFISWALITGGLSGVGTLLAGGHPLTILTAVIAAPITTLHPVLGVGFFTAAVQFYFAPPLMKDFESLSLKLMDFRSWWKNRVSRIILVFLFSSLGAGTGMWIALTKVIAVFA